MEREVYRIDLTQQEAEALAAHVARVVVGARNWIENMETWAQLSRGPGSVQDALDSMAISIQVLQAWAEQQGLQLPMKVENASDYSQALQQAGLGRKE